MFLTVQPPSPCLPACLPSTPRSQPFKLARDVEANRVESCFLQSPRLELFNRQFGEKGEGATRLVTAYSCQVDWGAVCTLKWCRTALS